MVPGLQQNLNLSQQLVITPQLQQAIKLLQLSHMELTEMVQQEIEQNPALEEAGLNATDSESTGTDDTGEIGDTALEGQTNRIISESETTGFTPEKETRPKEVTVEEQFRTIDWENYINDYNSTSKFSSGTENIQAPNYEAFTSEKKTLTDHLQWQLRLQGFTGNEEKIGHMIIGNLNRDGYLCSQLTEIAKACNSNIKIVKKVLSVLQTFDPPGVCARDLCETLLVQVKQLGINNPVIVNIIKYHLKNLENKNTNKIATALKISHDEVRAAVKILQHLEPKPGRAFSSEEPVYITPDIYVYKEDNDFKILLNDDGMPKLRINKFYKQNIANGKPISRDVKTYLNEKMLSASWLIKSIQQRQQTIYMVMESILKFQREFFEKGVTYLKPLILRDIAQDIDMHESTISRVTTNKYAQTPQGLFELKYFFNSSIKSLNGNALASESVKEKIKNLIGNEDSSKPLSDEQIVFMLEDADISIARRTVTKYRKVLNILPSNKRKQL
jgi:RNA polymerase sigma-54 factor